MTYRILLVEDDDAHAKDVGSLVESLIDCRLERARNRHDAWAKLQAVKYSAVVLDLYLGGSYEGELLLETMRSRLNKPPGTVVVSVSGNLGRAQRLKSEFGFVVEAIQKSDLLELKQLTREALTTAVTMGESEEGSEATQTGTPDDGRGSRVAITVAIIGALATVITAIIKACGG